MTVLIMLGAVALIAIVAAVAPVFARRRRRRLEDCRLRTVVTLLRAYSGRSGPTSRQWRRDR
jgi:hypothetical protein